ncbi:BTB/POZ domain-containing protein [Phanerochaete sordida]|uniref:BTB/POZ domain-containing protein n=1 Tax=Phanerochaete sordida TaxID=48140 RepID=A0A9P3G8R0_9APHY|nr:BTB/POZ domain-containing protein [Phanerochaete sordida]
MNPLGYTGDEMKQEQIDDSPVPIPQTEARAAKRPRSDPGPVEPQKHPDLWFADGNVVILSENTLFRVHRSQLTRKSQVLEALLSKIRETDKNGCIVFRTAEKAKDIAAFLDLLYNGWRNATGERLPWNIMASIMTLSHRWGFQGYKDQAVAMVSKSFPTNLVQRDRVVMQAEPCPVAFIFTEQISLVSVASELDIKPLRAAALYACVMLTPRALLEGITAPDGTVEKLSRDNIARVVQARSRLSLEHVKALNGLAEGLSCPRMGVQFAQSCAIGRRRIVNSMIEQLEEPSLYGILRPKDWAKIFKPIRGTADVCELCQKQMVATFDATRETVLSTLVSYFELPA